ncbi:MAG: PAS domain-containing protein [Bacteroidota bacterium]
MTEKIASHGKHLPGFAAFLLKDHLEEFANVALRISREANVPILKYIKASDEDLLKLMITGYSELLNGLIDGTTDEIIAKTVDSWKKNQLPIIEKDQIVTEDIAAVTKVRKEIFLQFLPRYTNDLDKGIAIIKEIDEYLQRYLSALFNTYTSILQERIERNSEEYKRSNMLYRQAEAVTKIGNYVWDLNTQMLTWSDELYRIYEIAPGTSVGDHLLRPYNHPDDNAVVDASIGNAIKTGKPFNFHYRILLNDGREKFLHARGEIEYDLAGKARKIFGTAQDVTEQKAIETQLEQNQRFVQKVADAAPSIITTYNAITGKYLFVNAGLRTLLGYDPKVVLEEGIAFFVSLIHPDDLAPIMEKNATIIEETNRNYIEGIDEPIAEFQYRLRHANGEYRWFHTFGTVFSRDENNRVDHILNISLDITEKIKAEQILIQKTTQLEQSNRSLEEFAFIASHDLKEPLRKISTLTDRLVSIENINLSDDGKMYLQKVVNSSIRMQQMVDDLLSLAQVSADQSFRKISLQTLLTDVLQTFDQKIEETNARVISNGLPEAVVVPSQFRQLFQNLVSNSLKFRKAEAPAELVITHHYLTAQATAQFSLQPAERYLQLTFSDNGIGFDNKFLPKIFSIFQRLHPRNKYEGTGIGLSICKKIVENHGGVIFANGTVNEGATFTVIVPDPAGQTLI